MSRRDRSESPEAQRTDSPRPSCSRYVPNRPTPAHTSREEQLGRLMDITGLNKKDAEQYLGKDNNIRVAWEKFKKDYSDLTPRKEYKRKNIDPVFSGSKLLDFKQNFFIWGENEMIPEGTTQAERKGMIQAAYHFIYEELRNRQFKASVNWWPDANPGHLRLVRACATPDGNCLCHAASTALWGHEGYNIELRRNLRDYYNDNKDAIMSRHNFENGYEIFPSAGGGFFYEQTADEIKEVEQEILNIRRPTDQPMSRNLYHLGKLGIFTLANMIRRPIIILACDPFEGSDHESRLLMQGVYLPLLHEPEDCISDIPLVIGYGAMHYNPFLYRKTVADDPNPALRLLPVQLNPNAASPELNPDYGLLFHVRHWKTEADRTAGFLNDENLKNIREEGHLETMKRYMKVGKYLLSDLENSALINSENKDVFKAKAAAEKNAQKQAIWCVEIENSRPSENTDELLIQLKIAFCKRFDEAKARQAATKKKEQQGAFCFLGCVKQQQDQDGGRDTALEKYTSMIQDKDRKRNYERLREEVKDIAEGQPGARRSKDQTTSEQLPPKRKR